MKDTTIKLLPKVKNWLAQQLSMSVTISTVAREFGVGFLEARDILVKLSSVELRELLCIETTSGGQKA